MDVEKIGDNVRFMLYGREQKGHITQATRELDPIPAWRVLLDDGSVEYVPKADVVGMVERSLYSVRVSRRNAEADIADLGERGCVDAVITERNGYFGVSLPVSAFHELGETPLSSRYERYAPA